VTRLGSLGELLLLLPAPVGDRDVDLRRDFCCTDFSDFDDVIGSCRCSLPSAVVPVRGEAPRGEARGEAPKLSFFVPAGKPLNVVLANVRGDFNKEAAVPVPVPVPVRGDRPRGEIPAAFA
jgi:hypothetical protein